MTSLVIKDALDIKNERDSIISPTEFFLPADLISHKEPFEFKTSAPERFIVYQSNEYETLSSQFIRRSINDYDDLWYSVINNVKNLTVEQRYPSCDAGVSRDLLHGNDCCLMMTTLDTIDKQYGDPTTSKLIGYIKNTISSKRDVFEGKASERIAHSAMSMVNLIKYLPTFKNRDGISFYFDDDSMSFGLICKLTSRHKGTLNLLVKENQEVSFFYAKKVHGPVTISGVAKFGRNIKNSPQIRLLFNLMD